MQLTTLFIPLVLIGGISYYSIHSVLQTKIEKGVESNLKEMANSLDSVFDNLGFVSKQMALDEDLMDRLSLYFDPETPNYQKIEIRNDIEQRISIISYANPEVGSIFYYHPLKREVLFQNLLVKTQWNPLQFEVLYKDRKLTYYTPHKSMYRYSDHPVISISQKTEGYEGSGEIYVYIETNYRTLRNLFSDESYNLHVGHLILNGSGQVVYSTVPDMFSAGVVLDASRRQTVDEPTDSHLFIQQGTGDWYVVAVVDAKELSGERDSWTRRFLLVSALSLVVAVYLAWRHWQMVSSKLLQLKNEIQLLGNYQFARPLAIIHVKEFDDLLHKFYTMRQRIQELLIEVEEKEKRKLRLEVEKLKHQINPHFIHNTLNTIQWIARMNKQDEIIRLVSIFTRILHYNLGKEGEIVTVEEELNALRDYVELQQIRYNHNFEITINADQDTLGLPIARFVIQPIVENALYHAFQDNDGMIQVDIRREGERHFAVSVKDDGQGMSEETVRRLLSSDNSGDKKTGLGIGLSFVQQTVHQYFGKEYGLDIQSKLQQGTTVHLILPVDGLKESLYDNDIKA